MRSTFASRSRKSSASEAITRVGWYRFFLWIRIVEVSLLFETWYDSWMAKRSHSDKDDGWRWALDYNAFIRICRIPICSTRGRRSLVFLWIGDADEDAKTLSEFLDRDTNFTWVYEENLSYAERKRGGKSVPRLWCDQ